MPAFRSGIDPPYHGVLAPVIVVWMVVAAAGCGDQGRVIARERPSDLAIGGAGGASVTSVERPVFRAPELVIELSDPEAKDQDPTLTADLLEIFFFSDRSGNEDIWTARRSSVDDPWDPPTLVAELSSDEFDENPAVSRDGRRIWFYSRRDPLGIWYSERATRDDRWSTPVSVPIEGSEGAVIAPSIDADELRLAVSMGESNARDIYESLRPALNDPWGELAQVPGLNSDVADSTPFLIDDGLELLLSSGRSGDGDLFWAYRETVDGPVETVSPLTELNDPNAFESHPYLSVDRRTVFFGSDRSGGTDIYEATMATP